MPQAVVERQQGESALAHRASLVKGEIKGQRDRRASPQGRAALTQRTACKRAAHRASCPLGRCATSPTVLLRLCMSCLRRSTRDGDACALALQQCKAFRSVMLDDPDSILRSATAELHHGARSADRRTAQKKKCRPGDMSDLREWRRASHAREMRDDGAGAARGANEPMR